MTLQTERVQTLEQMHAFVEGSEAVDFTAADREDTYTLMLAGTLVCFYAA